MLTCSQVNYAASKDIDTWVMGTGSQKDDPKAMTFVALSSNGAGFPQEKLFLPYDALGQRWWSHCQ